MSLWKEYRVKDVAYTIGSGTTPTSGNEKYYEDGVHHWINTGDLHNSEVFGGKKRITDLALKEVSSLRFYPVDTVLVAMYGASIGKTGLLKVKATVNQACCAIVPNNQLVTPEFLFYRITDYKDKLISESFGGTQPNVSQAIVANIKLTFPSIGNQQQIVKYLDAKTAAIDKRIAVLKKKQEVYSRLRKSIINRAVTRGLNPDFPLKDSGVDWIGMIPEHWEVRRMKDIFTERKDISETGTEDLLSVSEYYGVARRKDKMEDDEYESRADSLVGYKICKKDDLVINIMLAWKTGLGFSDYDGIVSPSYAVYSGKCICSHYYHYLMRTNQYTSEFKRHSKGIIDSRLRLYTDRFNNISAITPPLPEQRAIADYLDEKCAKIDAAVENIGKQIDALKRLKRALINEVVTGKRKV